MFGKLRIDTELNTKKFEKQVEYIKDKMDNLERLLSDEKLDFSLRLKYEDELERLQNRLADINNKTSDIGGNAEKSSRGLKTMGNSLSRIATRLLGVAGIYGILSKAETSYMSSDSKLSNQLQANWVGLGTILQPAIELIVKLMKKAVTSVLYFMSVLTGTDYIAKANANAIKKQADATNKLAKANQKATASFDEMNIYNESSSSESVGGLSSQDTSSLFTLNDISENTRKAIEKLANALKPVYEMVKDVISWGAKHPDVIMGILGGTALLGFLGKVLGVGGLGGSGLLGIYGVLSAIIAIASIKFNLESIWNNFEKVNQALKRSDKVRDNVLDKNKELIKSTDDEAKAQIKEGKAIDGTVDKMFDYANSFLEVAKAQNKSKGERNALEVWYDQFTGTTEDYNKSIKNQIDLSYEQIQSLYSLYEQGQLNEEQTRKLKEMMEQFNEEVFISTNGSSDLLYAYRGAGKGSSELADNMKNNLNKQLATLNKELGESSQNKLPMFKSIAQNLKLVIDTSDIDKTNNKISGIKTILQNFNKATKIPISTDLTSFKNTLETFLNGSFRNTFSTLMGTMGIKTNFPHIKLFGGGIVNNPGHGVPITGNVIGGEAGSEMVMPLTPEVFDRIGQSIANHMVINTTINNNMDGKTISRQLAQVTNERNFATNGRG